jgi:AraC-like DNA-binding protein
VLEAKRLLTRREMSVKNIAYDLGFLEPQNFTRFFRTQTGLSPKAFRRMLDS